MIQSGRHFESSVLNTQFRERVRALRKEREREREGERERGREAPIHLQDFATKVDVANRLS